jgi:hypothetical protein
MRNTLLVWGTLGILLAVFAAPGFTQTFGEITGRVADSSGAAAPDAAVTATNISTNAARSTVSNQTGDYSFPSMPPGIYNVKVERQGFKTAESNNVNVQVQQSVRLDFALELGQITESVLVEANAVQLQVENATIGTVIENKRIVELPLNGRNYLQLVALTPNVTTLSPAAGQAGSRQGGDRANQSISVAGQRTMFDYFTLDGVNNTDPNFNTYVVLPSIDALQEFKVQTGVYPAEFGHNATQINVLTKSGGNQYHGALFEFLRNDALDANPYSFTSKPQAKSPFKWNQYGFELDGPIRIPKLFNGQDKLFFMGNYEAFRQRQNSQNIYSVPTAAMFAGDFSGFSKPIYDPATPGQVFPGNIIPSARIDPISAKLLEYYVPANIVTATPSSNFVRSDAAPINKDQFVLRMDFVESAKSQWSGRYSWGDENQSNEGLTLDGTKILTNFEQYMGSNTRTFSPNVVNEARFGYTRFYNSIGTFLAFNTNVVDSLGIPGFSGGDPVTWGIPNVTLANYTSIGDSTEGPYANNNNTLQFVDNLSIIKGQHTFRFGGEYRRENYNQVGNQFARGQFTFQPNATQNPVTKAGGDSFAEFLIGDMYQSEAAVSVGNATFQRNAFALYVDDTWKLTPKITLALGLRYELTPPFLDTLGNLFSVYIPYMDDTPNVADKSRYPSFIRQGKGSDPYAGIPIRWPQINAIQNGILGDRLVQTDYNDLAPRVGITYSPDSKWVIRTGAGMFYNQDTGNPRFDMARNIAGRIRVNSQLNNPTLFWSNALASIGGGTANITSPYAFANKYERRTPYTWEYLLNVQRELSHNMVVEVGYLGSISRKLESLRSVNEALPGATGSVQSRSPYPTFGRIQLVDNATNAEYNSASITLTKRFSAGFSILSSYTYARSVDDSSGIRVQGQDTLFPQNSYCLKCEWGLSAFDTRHRFVTSALWDLPIGKGRRLDVENGFANALVGGWQTGAIWTVQSGFPQTITIGGVDRSGAGGLFDRPNATGVSPYLSDPTPSRWYNLSAFVEQPAGTFGNVARNGLIGPNFFTLDFSAHKEFRMPYSEQHALQFRFEAFNVLNHPVWGAPNGNILSSGFGAVTGTAVAMRQLQLALKYFF